MILKYVCPDYRVKSLFDISAKWLKRNGYTKIVVDIDNTLLPRDKNLVGPRAMTWIRQLHQPLPMAYKQITKAMGGGKILFVGDQLLTDVLGAKVAGHPVVFVESLGGKEHFITRCTRKLEKFFLNRLHSNNMMPKERVL